MEQKRPVCEFPSDGNSAGDTWNIIHRDTVPYCVKMEKLVEKMASFSFQHVTDEFILTCRFLASCLK